MNEITKLYENAGIEKEYEYVGHYPKTDENGIILPMVYPPFTAEKQINLIKLFADKGMLLFTNSRDYKGTYKVTGFYKGGDYCSNIGEALASCICNNWQDLTDAEKQQIKNILE